MTDFSIKEIEALCVRAARGSYMQWGTAEEGAAAAAWLARAGLAGVESFTALLHKNDGKSSSEVSPNIISAEKLGKQGGWVCPVHVGCYLSDDPSSILSNNALLVEQVAYPSLLLPFLARIAEVSSKTLKVEWANCKILVSAANSYIEAGAENATVSSAERVVVSLNDGPLQGVPAAVARCIVAPADLKILEELAGRTFLPESDLSRATGAGGGSVDDD